MKRKIAVVAVALGALVGLGAGPANAVIVHEEVGVSDAGPIKPLSVDLTVDTKSVTGLVNICISGHTIPVPLTCIKL